VNFDKTEHLNMRGRKNFDRINSRKINTIYCSIEKKRKKQSHLISSRFSFFKRCRLTASNPHFRWRCKRSSLSNPVWLSSINASPSLHFPPARDISSPFFSSSPHTATPFTFPCFSHAHTTRLPELGGVELRDKVSK